MKIFSGPIIAIVVIAFPASFASAGLILDYSTYLGGNSYDESYGIVSQNGEVYVIGKTASKSFPTVNSYQSSYAGADAFISKFSSLGSQLLYSTFWGGTYYDNGRAIAVEDGEVYATGWTSSTDFPILNSYQSSSAGGLHDVYVSKFSSTGSQLLFSTYLGGGATTKATLLPSKTARSI